jgi:hypothetical protein
MVPEKCINHLELAAKSLDNETGDRNRELKLLILRLISSAQYGSGTYPVTEHARTFDAAHR